MNYFEIKCKLPYFGLALAFCWTYSIQRALPHTLGQISPILVFVGTSFACIVFFIISKLLKRNISTLLPLRVGFPALAMFAIVPFALLDKVSIAPLLLGSTNVLCGIIVAWLYLLWGSFYKKLAIKPVIAVLFISTMIAAGIKIILMFLAPYFIGQLLCALLPLLSSLCWSKIQLNELPASKSTDRFSASTLFTLASTAIGVVAFSFAIGVIRTLDLSYFSQPFFYEVISHIVEIAVCTGVLVLVYNKREDFEFSRMWFFALLAIASGLLLSETLVGPLSSLSFAVLSASQMIVLVFLWLGLSDVAHNSSYCSDMVFGSGWLCYCGPVALGSACTLIFGFSFKQESLALIVIYVLLIATFFFVSKKTPKDLQLLTDLNPPLSADGLDQLDKRVEVLAIQHNLTPREKEVILLYAQGRNRPFISESLFISENTVRDHIRSAYRKIGIHNKQELIDKVSNL